MEIISLALPWIPITIKPIGFAAITKLTIVITAISVFKIVLNTTKTNEIFGASLSSNQVTLPAGEYWCEGMAEAYVVNSHKVKLHDTTNTVDLIIGVSGRTANGGPSTIAGRFTLTGTAVLELQHYCSTTRATDGFGSPTNASVVEAYAELKIWKVG